MIVSSTPAGSLILHDTALGYVELSYGEFGPDTYGMYCEFDGSEHVVCIRNEDRQFVNRAYEIAERIASGWRALNW